MASEFILFTPLNNGLGVSLTCGSSTNRAAFPNPTQGSVWAVNNTGLDYVFLAFDGPTIESTLACMAFAPGITYVGIPNAGGSGAPTHVAGITAAASIIVQITAGNVDVS